MPCFEKSKAQRIYNRGLLKNRFEFFGVLNKGFLKIDAGELFMFEDISYSGQIKKDLFQGEGELKISDEITMRGIWHSGSLVSGRITLKNINFIDYIEVNRKDNTYKLKTNKEAKLIPIVEDMNFEFQENKHDLTVELKLSEAQGLIIKIMKKITTLTLTDKYYTVSTVFAPMLYYIREYLIEGSKINFSIYPCYKAEYILRTLKTENRYNIRHLVIYPEGKCFMGKTDNIPKGDKKLNGLQLAIPGILIDLDEFLIDNIKSLNFFDVFSLKTGNKRLLKKPTRKIKRGEIEKGVFMRLINSIQQKKSILRQLVNDEIDKCQTKFDWKLYGSNYFEGVLAISANSFDYNNRLSKQFLTDVVEKNLIQFNWTKKSDIYFQILND